MIVDSNLVLKEGDAYSTGTGSAIALNSLKIPGKMEPIPFLLKITEDYAGGTSIAFKLQQSDTEAGNYTDVPGSTFSIALADLTQGAKSPIKWLPRGVTKSWIKLAYTATGTFSAGKVFCALMREDHEPYESGLYLDGNKAITQPAEPRNVVVSTNTKGVTSGVATAFGADTIVIASNEASTTKYRVMLSATPGTLSAAAVAAATVANLNTSLASITLSTTANSLVAVTVLEETNNVVVATGTLSCTV